MRYSVLYFFYLMMTSFRDLDFQELGLQSKSASGNREVMQGLTCKNEPATEVSGHDPVWKSFI